ncbi:ketol-acid reductoisomerase [Mucisphaera calidilacus]|uniref:Ketol-acid reductoisomerase (NADP(+)) n=1 Tax=Mucisphaera calidilacus TaxID=2527982 RepID=A0A518BYS0_9BACT|nr:ketol-acid reductoisomerase [Mucisphaera calidilacus]QDU72121.1 Ketol-acid reductoisomerase [Mucisphaera calidilacus]
MAIETLYDKDGSLDGLSGKTVAVLGYGSQGHAHAQNLRDSGVKVIVANRKDSANGKLASEHGFEPMAVDEAVKAADMVILTLPDEVQPDVYEQSIAPNLTAGMTLGFTHGFNVHFKTIAPPADVDVVMVAPKGPGHTVRWEFEKGGGVPCLMAIHQDASGTAREKAMAWAIGVGGGKGGILVTSFKDECETDLFGEQVVLCGGLSESIKKGFEVLTEAGYPPELAYFEVCHELELIINLIKRGGLDYMRYSISNTAEFGDYYTGPKICDDATKQRMAAALKHIQDGGFAKAFRDDYAKGFPWFKKQREENKGHGVEKVGKELRAMMPWLDPVDLDKD